MIRSLFRCLMPALLVGGLTVLSASSARADLQVTLQEDGGAVVTVIDVPSGTSGTYGSPPIVFGDFTVNQLGASSNSPGTPTLSKELSSTVDLTNNSSASHTLTIMVTDVGFTAPNNGFPIVYRSNFSPTVAVGGTGQTGTFQGYVDPNNAPFGTTTTSGPQPLDLSSVGAFSSSATGSFTNSGGTYSVSSKTTLVFAGNGDINYSTSIILSPTPEPGTMAMAVAGLPLVGLVTWLRRRRTAA